MERVMIVDDEFVIAAHLERLVRGFGYGCFGTFASAGDALEAIAHDLPDIALIDLSLRHNQSGLGLAKDLVARQVSVIFVSGSPPSSHRPNWEVSAIPWLAKPVDETALRRALERLKTSK